MTIIWLISQDLSAVFEINSFLIIQCLREHIFKLVEQLNIGAISIEDPPFIYQLSENEIKDYINLLTFL